MTVNGLATVDLSTLSVMQQVLMFFQMLIGSLVRDFVQAFFGKGNRTGGVLMIGLCFNRHDHCTTIFLSLEIQTCDSGAAKTIFTSKDDIQSCYHAYSASECS